MLLALTGYETALVVVAAVFIAFALICALVVPRSRPGFPGRNLGVFLTICALLFASQLTAVLVLAEVGEADEAVHEETTTETTPPETGAQGDPTAGKEVFASAGCKSCHTLADSGATGAVGPNLDTVKPAYEKVVTQVTNGGGAMPPFGQSLSEQQIQDVAAYVSSVAGT